MLRGSDAIHVATVLEDCMDQLSVLGRIMPASFEGRPDAMSVSFSLMYHIYAQYLDKHAHSSRQVIFHPKSIDIDLISPWKYTCDASNKYHYQQHTMYVFIENKP